MEAVLHNTVRTTYCACPVHVGPVAVAWVVRERLAKRVPFGTLAPALYIKFR